MTNIGTNNAEALQYYILKVAQKIADENSFNSVVTGIIQESYPGYYRVKLANNNTETLVTAFSLQANESFEVDDYIYLLKAPVASGDQNKSQYYIFGLVNETQEEYFNLSEWERFQATGGKKEVVEEKTYTQFGESNETVITDSRIIQNIQAMGAFAITGYFTCFINSSPNRISDYGIRVKFIQEKDGVDTKVAEFDLGTGRFVGQPFNMDRGFQKRVITLEKEYSFNKIILCTYATYNFIAGPNTEIAWNEKDRVVVDNITLQAGSILQVVDSLSVKVDAEDNKNYFYKTTTEDEGEIEDSVTLKASVFYNAQPLVNSSIQYYWFIQDDSITEEDDSYLSFAGEGWRCLNTWKMTSFFDGDPSVFAKVRIWDNKKNSFNFNNQSEIFTNYLSKYSNLFKCIIKYQGAIVASNDFEILNFNKEDFEVQITSSASNNMLFLETDIITLSAQVISKNKVTNFENYSISYQWQNKKGGGEFEDIIGQIQNTLQIKDNDFTVEATNAPYEMTEEEEAFRCVATMSLGELLHNEFSEPIIVTSKVAVAAELEQPTTYKYYISSSDAVLFDKKSETGEDTKWLGDWLIYDNDNDNPAWILVEGKIDNEAFDYLNNMELFPSQYLYYTAQTAWVETKGNHTTALQTENWSYPRLLRGRLGSGVELSFEAIDQLNAFNDLTRGGDDKGIYLGEKQIYIRTKDTSPVKGKTYYWLNSDKDYVELAPTNIKYTRIYPTSEEFYNRTEQYYYLDTNGGPATYQQVAENAVYDTNALYYILEDVYQFTDDVQYYEVIDGKSLYINADYIRTGAIQVGSGTDVKFYANVADPAVSIGGFTVTGNSIENADRTIYIGADGVRFASSKLDADLIQSINIYYLKNDSPSNKPNANDQNWSSNYPEWENNKYIWQKTVTNYATQDKTPTVEIICLTGAIGPQGGSGPAGKYITEIIEQYALSSSGTPPQENSSDWKSITSDSNFIPIERGTLRYRRQKYIWSDGSTITYSIPKLDETDQRIVEWCAETDSTKIDGGKIYCTALSALNSKLGYVESLLDPVFGDKNVVTEVRDYVVNGVNWTGQQWPDPADGFVYWENSEAIIFTISFPESDQVKTINWQSLKVSYIEYLAANILTEKNVTDEDGGTGGFFKQDINLLTLTGFTYTTNSTNNSIVFTIPANKLRVKVAGIHEAAAKPKNYIGISYAYYIARKNSLLEGAILDLDDKPSILFPQFKVDEQGRLTATDISVTGQMAVSNGSTIGGFSVIDNHTDPIIGLVGKKCGFNSDPYLPTSGEQVFTFWAGAQDPGIAPFQVSNTGNLYSTRGKIGNWNISKLGMYSSGNIKTILNEWEDPSFKSSDGSLEIELTGDASWAKQYEIDDNHPVKDKNQYSQYGSLSFNLGKYYNGDKNITIHLSAESDYSEHGGYMYNTRGNLDGLWSLNRIPLNLIAAGSFQAIPQVLAEASTTSDYSASFSDRAGKGFNEQTNLFTYLSIADCENYGCSLSYIENYYVTSSTAEIDVRTTLTSSSSYGLKTTNHNRGAVIFINNFDLKEYNRAYVKIWCSAYGYDEYDSFNQKVIAKNYTASTKSLLEQLEIRHIFGREKNSSTIKPYIILYPKNFTVPTNATMSELRVIVHYEIYGYNGPKQTGLK